ncbi:General secretion pathway L, partial [mine drainage metagenome]
SCITFTEVRLPVRSRRRWAEAIPFVLEDLLATDVEELHFAHGEPNPAGLLPVAIVDRNRMADWMAALEASGIRPDVLWPDIVLVPWIPGRWSLAREKNRITLRWGREQGCTLEDPLAEAVFKRLWAASPADSRPREIVFYGAADDPFLLNIRSEPGREMVTWTLGEPSASEEASRGPVTGFNLLQGAWAPGHHRQETWTRWKPSVFLAAGWAGLL